MDETRRSAREMAVLESNAIAVGATIDSLMEGAGRAVAEEAAQLVPDRGARVAVVAGSGNNGGDGTCAAHYLLQWGYAPEIWLPRPAFEIRSPAARRCYDRIARHLPVHETVPTARDLGAFALVIDALLGTGQAGAPRPPYSDAVAAMDESAVPILSVDEPTGLGSAASVRPGTTVTFTCAKEGMDGENSGKIIVRDIGIPEVAKTEVGPGEFHLFPLAAESPRTGRIVVIAGGPYAGAPALTALAAMRAGAERATVLCPAAIVHDLRAYSPTLVVIGIGADRFGQEDVAPIRKFLGANRHTAIALGMGAGREPGTVAAYAELLAALDPKTPVVVDADGLESALQAAPGEDRPWVLTPNAGELLRIAGLASEATLAERQEAVDRLSRRHGVTFLAKGEPDLLGDGRHRYLNRHHAGAATVAGVGDLLSGVVGALLAEGVAPLAAARLGSYWVGDAGLRAARHRGHGLIATDLLDEIPHALVDGLQRLRA